MRELGGFMLHMPSLFLAGFLLWFLFVFGFSVCKVEGSNAKTLARGWGHKVQGSTVKPWQPELNFFLQGSTLLISTSGCRRLPLGALEDFRWRPLALGPARQHHSGSFRCYWAGIQTIFAAISRVLQRSENLTRTAKVSHDG